MECVCGVYGGWEYRVCVYMCRVWVWGVYMCGVWCVQCLCGVCGMRGGVYVCRVWGVYI